MNLVTTVTAVNGGADAIAGNGMDYLFSPVGTFQSGDGITLLMHDATSGLIEQIGYGDATGQVPTFALTFNSKLYAVAGTELFFSALNLPSSFNDPNGTGNGFIPLTNNLGTEESGVAIAPYQGKLAVFSRRSIQIWAIDPDPTKNAKQQVLTNIGAVAKLSVQAVGDFDVVFLADSGFRSLRPRELSNNAVVADLGTPIDALVQGVLATLTDAQKAAACGVIEPTSGRYWCYIPTADGSAGSIYVFSFFQSSQIAAWTTYTPSYDLNGVQTPFVPEKFWTQDGQVFCRAGDNVFAYGGTDNVTYDNCGLNARLPWLDADAPATRKHFQGMDCGIEGDWLIKFSGDYATQNFSNAYNHRASSFQLGNIPLQGKHGTHFSLDFTEKSKGYARLSSVLVHFRMEDEKK